jgi:cysteine desulfurase
MAAGRRAAFARERSRPALCVGFGEAARLLPERSAADHEHVERLWAKALASLGGGWSLNGSADRSLPRQSQHPVDGIDAARLISELRQIAFSAGSACASGRQAEPRPVRDRLSDGRRGRSIRIGFGRYTSEEDLSGRSN